MTDARGLRDSFGGDGVTFEDLAGGHVLCRLAGPAGHGGFLLRGAQLWSWAPAGQEDLLWHSTAVPPRAGAAPYGGIPLCWPWLGDPPRAGLPFHGHVRLHDWELRAIDRTPAGGFAVRLTTGDRDIPALDQPVALAVEFRLGADLHVALRIRNPGTADLVSGGALHTYLRIGDRRRIALEGLAGLTWQGEVDEPLQVDAGGVPPGDGAWSRNYFSADAEVRVRSASPARTLTVTREGSGTLTLWNPGPGLARTMAGIGDDEWPAFLCLEAGNIRTDERVVPPGGEHVLATRIRSA